MLRETVRFAFAAFAIAFPALAAQYNLELKPEAVKIQFTLTDPLHTVRGTFNLKQGTIGFDTESGKASGQVVVDVTSGQSGSDARDSKMHASVLESKKFPEAVFSPNRMEGAVAIPGKSTVKVHGVFTIHGTAHEVTMDVQTSDVQTAGGADRMHAAMSFDIPYVAWGMKDPSVLLLKVGKTVRMTIEADGVLQKR
jgi:polyisoprenoid-binding protein YceI